MARPAPNRLPAMPKIPAIRPSFQITCPFIMKMTSEVRLVVRLMAFVCALAWFRFRCAKTFSTMIRKVPVPGP